jgi:phosphoserine phosphatase RsbU/P
MKSSMTAENPLPRGGIAGPGSVRAYPARDIAEQAPRGDTSAMLARQIRGRETLRRASSQLVLQRPLPDLFKALLELLFGAVRAERGAILLLEGDRLVIKASRSRRGGPVPTVSQSIARRVLDDRVALILDNALEDPHFGAADSVIFASVRSALAAPLWTLSGGREEVVGLVYLDTPRFPGAFDEEDLGLVAAIANVAAVKIQNARLLEDSVEKQRLEEEMRVAAQLQAGLLPASPPALRGWTIAGVASPCRAVGGDYYDWDVRPDGVRLAFGDVAGKGTPAALVMTMVRALVRTFWDEDTLSAAAARINRALLDTVPAGRFATAVLARLDPASGRLDYVNAGHPAPLVIRARGGLEVLESGGLPLGLFDGMPYTAGRVNLERGDTVLLFSDGVLEAGGSTGGEEFGTDRLASLARAGRALDAQALVAWIAEELEAFSSGGATADDRTVMAVKRSSSA